MKNEEEEEEKRRRKVIGFSSPPSESQRHVNKKMRLNIITQIDNPLPSHN